MQVEFNLNNVDVDDLISNQKKFNDFVYTPLGQIATELEARWQNSSLENKVNNFLKNNIPNPLKEKFKAVIFRQVFTPNYELRHFLKTLESISINPMLLEYHQDKFMARNPVKHALGKMKFQQMIDNDVGLRIESRNVIEFNGKDGKKLHEIYTTWSQSLIDFHHEVLSREFPQIHQYLYDGSEWFSSEGNGARDYYSRYLALFIRNGVLFENFILEGDELRFVKEVFLPSFIRIWKAFSQKPLISALLPLDSQSDSIWMFHPLETLAYIDSKKMI